MAHKKETNRRFRLVMLPWLAHGHLVPYLQLANELHERNFDIYFCSTPVVLSPIRSGSTCAFNSKINMVEIDLSAEDFPQLPASLHTTKNLPRELVFVLVKAFRMSSPRFCEILNEIKPDLIIYDVFQPWAARAAQSQKIPAVCYAITGAASIAYGRYLTKYRLTGSFPFPAIYMRPHELKNLKKSAENIDPEDLLEIPTAMELSDKLVLINTSMEIEGKYIDYLSEDLGETVVPIGSLINIPQKNATAGEEDKEEDKAIMKWLDNRKSKHLTLYISFGSEYYLTREEIREMAKGLETSGADFIWVIRFPAGEEVAMEEALPEGFLERVEGKGIVVEKWAPQLKILAHSSIGGFVMQCGWNSFLESIHFEIPLVAIPMHSEQFVTARMAAELGIATEVLRDEENRLHGGDIAEAVKTVLKEKKGEEMRAKVRELNAEMKAKGKQGIDNTAKMLSQLCLSSNTN